MGRWGRSARAATARRRGRERKRRKRKVAMPGGASTPALRPAATRLLRPHFASP
jgi:hypothetical protein